MQALELRDNSLQWETERQNRILQSAAEQKKKQMSMENARRSDARQNVPAEMQFALEEWIEKVHRIPDMRSALIPVEDGVDSDEWSKPFSLAKADMEPWLSFYKGYKQSRLFLETTSAQRSASGDECWPTPDFAVRAILELKQISIKIIAEPPVQINRQVAYFDLEGELQVNRDPTRVRALLVSAANVHDAELRKAVEKGRDMGNMLHDALLGEGHRNLITAWTRVFNRKPSIEELHLMLTTGRVKVSAERKPPTPEVKPKTIETRDETVAGTSIPVKRPEASMSPMSPTPPIPKAIPARVEPAAIAKMVADTEPDDDDDEMPFQREAGNNKRKILWHLLQATVCCAALAGIFFAF